MKRIVFLFVVGCVLLTACTSAGGNTADKEYTFSLQASDFVSVINNPYYPLIPGTIWVYEAKVDGVAIERNTIEVLSETKEIMGVKATVVHDLVYVDGQIVEGTYDWFAQDKDGNVWYLGEAVDNYQSGKLINHTGSWEWGVNGALPGIIMWADPSEHLNETYYQEYYAEEAEDQGEVLSVTENVSVPYGSYENVVKTLDTSALDPDLRENKFYVSGIGVIKEVDMESGEEVVLIDFIAP